MFRALNHEGVAAECLYELLVGDRKLPTERHLRAFTACAVIATALHRLSSCAVIAAPARSSGA